MNGKGDGRFAPKDNATRAETAFLEQIIGEAVSAGVKTVTLCDDEGAILPDEFAEFMGDVPYTDEDEE